ncbi:MAG TPA: AsmA family protein, partial [Methylomirabilota bacterium]|nr:AsmA family protein [Methylomirabilota bacterium]
MTRRRVLVATLVALVVLTLLAAGVVLSLPAVARRVAVAQIRALTAREAAIDHLDLDLFAGRLVVRGFRLADRTGPEPLGRFAELHVRFRPVALLTGHVWLEDVRLVEPSVRIVRLGSGRFNISDLLGRPAARRRLDVTVDRFTIDSGTVLLEDRTLSPPRTWTAERLALEARNVSTLRSD